MAGMKTLRTATQNYGIAGLDTQRGRIRGYVGPAFIDDANHAQRYGDALNPQAVWTFPFFENTADRVVQADDRFEADSHGFNPIGIEHQAIEQCSAQLFLPSRTQVECVGFHNRRCTLPQRGRRSA